MTGKALTQCKVYPRTDHMELCLLHKGTSVKLHFMTSSGIHGQSISAESGKQVGGGQVVRVKGCSSLVVHLASVFNSLYLISSVFNLFSGRVGE